MSVTDIRLSVGLPTHPKTKKLIRRTGESGAWRLVCLFLWVAQSHPDGNLSGMDGEDIELAADWRGEPGAFISALIEVGFVEGEDGSYSIHDWGEHNPWSSGFGCRSKKARWNALIKHHGREEAIRLMPEYAKSIGAASGNSATSSAIAEKNPATSINVAETSSAPSPSPSPSPNPPLETDNSVGKKTLDAPPKKPGVACPEKIPPELWVDWLAVRKAKRVGPVTPTALGAIEREADQAGIGLESALRECCARGWAGFKASWLLRDNAIARAPPSTMNTAEASRLAAARTIFGTEIEGHQHGRIIDITPTPAGEVGAENFPGVAGQLRQPLLAPVAERADDG